MTDIKASNAFSFQTKGRLKGKYISHFYFDIHKPPPYSGPPIFDTPPSLSVSSECGNYRETSGQKEGGSQIRYCIRARLLREGVQVVETHQDLDLVPPSPAAPPLEPSDFPNEYKQLDVKKFPASLGRKSSGSISVAAFEPPPLVCAAEKTTSTKLNLRFRYRGRADHELEALLRCTDCEVKTTVKAATFFSVAVQHAQPTIGLATRSGNTMRVKKAYASQPRKLHLPSWSKIPGNDAESQDGLDTWETELPLLLLNQNHVVNGVVHYFPPTYSSALVSRRYTAVVEIKLLGARDATFHLEVPLQICYQGRVPKRVLTSVGDGSEEQLSPPESFLLPSETTAEDPPIYIPKHWSPHDSVRRPASVPYYRNFVMWGAPVH